MERNLGQWKRHGLGLFSVLRKEDERFVGRIGYLLWDTDRWENAVRTELEGDLELEIGWTVLSAFWGNGYATEAAIACRDYAFAELGRERIISLIEPANPLRSVAEKIGSRTNATSSSAETVRLYSLGKRPAR
jgi:RimJ/RimL family protein N-acetyltransferase